MSAVSPQQPRSDMAVSRAVVVGVIVPVLVTLVALATEVAIKSDLPDPVATHWGSEGVDGYASLTLVMVLTVAVVGVLPALMGLSVVPSLRRGDRGFALKMMSATAAGLSVFVAGVVVGSLWIQRGLSDASDVGSVLPVLGVALALAALVGVGAWFAQPHHETVDVSREPADALPLAPGERAAWVGRAEMSGGVLAVVIAAESLVTALAVVMWFTSDTGVAILVTAIAVLLAVLLASFTVFTVRADARGLTVRSVARTITLRVPAADIADVAVTDVAGLGQYGGFGIRMIPGATAVVMRSGPALEVTRRSGRKLVVTLDHPEEAASVLAVVAGVGHADQG